MTRRRTLVTRAALALVAVWLGAGGGVPARAASPAAPDGNAAVIDALLEKTGTRWSQRRHQAQSGDRIRAAETGREIVDGLREDGIERFEVLAQAAALEGERELSRANATAALDAFRLASALDARLVAAYWGEARARLAAGEGWLAAARPAVAAVRAHFGSFWAVYHDVLEVGTVLVLALLLTGAALLVTLLVLYGPILVHEVEERLPLHWNPAWRRAVGWAIVLSPATVQWLGVFALLPWAVVLLPLARRAERAVVVAWLLAVAAAVPLLGALWSLGDASASASARVAVDSADRALRRDMLGELTALSEAQPQDATWKLLAARVIATREPDQAIHMLREAADLAPGDSAVRITLGNVFFRSGKREIAGVLYREALQRDPNNVVAMFNLSRVRTAVLDMTGADAALADARKISADRVRWLQNAVPADAVADADVDVRAVARRVVSDEAGPALRQALSLNNPVSLGALGTLFAAIVLGLKGRVFASRRCERCGRAFCERCSGEDQGRDVCLACHQLFSRREGLAPAARQEQARRIDRRIKSVARGRAVLHALWPGLAHVHQGRTASGAFLAFVWSFLLLGGLVAEQLVPDPAVLHVGTPGRAFFVLAACFWALVQLPRFRPAPLALRGGR